MLMSLTNSVVHTIRETTKAQQLIAAAINVYMYTHWVQRKKFINWRSYIRKEIHEIDYSIHSSCSQKREIPYKPQIMVKTQMRLLRGQPGPEKPQESYWNCSPRCFSPGGRRSCFDTFFHRAAGANYLVTGWLYFTAVVFVIFCVDYYYWYSTARSGSPQDALHLHQLYFTAICNSRISY